MNQWKVTPRIESVALRLKLLCIFRPSNRDRLGIDRTMKLRDKNVEFKMPFLNSTHFFDVQSRIQLLWSIMKSLTCDSSLLCIFRCNQNSFSSFWFAFRMFFFWFWIHKRLKRVEPDWNTSQYVSFASFKRNLVRFSHLSS